MKRVLVTGGAGFIGSHTVDYLLKMGHEVVVIDNLTTGKLSHLDLFNPRLRFVQGDVLEYALVKKEIAGCQSVLHLAALPSVPESIKNPLETLKINTLGFVNLLQAVREMPGPVRLVYASSAAVYGCPEQVPASEDHLLSSSLSPYALEKANNERYAALFSNLFGIKLLGLRYFNVYGARQDPLSPYSGVISKFIDCYRQQQPVTFYGDGEQSRDFIHVEDVARANVLALQSDYCGILNIATGKSQSLKKIIAYLNELFNVAIPIVYDSPRKGDILQSFAAIEKAEHFLKFRYSTELAEGLKMLLASS